MTEREGMEREEMRRGDEHLSERLSNRNPERIYKIDKAGLKKLVESRDYNKIATAQKKRRTASTLISFLYFTEPFVYYAAEALGVICGELERRGDEEFVREILRRLFWHLRDESGAYCRGAPLAIGEIGRNAPKAFEGFKNILLSLVRNEEVELKYVIYAIGRAAENMLDAYPNPIEELLPFLQHEDFIIRIYTVITLCRLGARFKEENIEEIFKKNEYGSEIKDFRIYIDGEILSIDKNVLMDFVSDCVD